MYFQELAYYFQKLEATTLRNVMVEILADLFSKTTPEEIEKICYLLQGRVVPLYHNLEFGLAEKMVIKTISQVCSVSEKEVIKNFKELGDLGKTIEELKKRDQKITDTFEKLNILQVYNTLLQIAQTSGEGSIEKKISLFASLLKKADPLSSCYIVRIPLDKLRLGFSDMTILDALSWLLISSKKERHQIEKSYNVRPDLGFIARTIKEKGLKGLKSIAPQVGTPILMARADRLENPKEILEKIGKCAIEFKYDGLRLQIHYQKKDNTGKTLIKLFSRNLEEMTLMFPEIIQAVKQQVKSEEIIFEGEVVAYNPKTGVLIPFQQTMQRKRKYNIEEKAKEIPVKLFAFELLYHNGKNLIEEPYSLRKELLNKVIKAGKTIEIAKEKITASEKEIEAMFIQSINQGFEGIIAKKLNGVYQAGVRGFNWIKFKRAMSKKLIDTFDVLVMGYTKGEGKRTGFGIGQFLTGVFDNQKDQFTTITKIGTGLTDQQFQEFIKRVKPLEVSFKPNNYNVDKLLEPDVWLKPSLVVEIAADEITRSQIHTTGRILGPSKSGKAQEVKEPGYALRFPRLVSFRDDKGPSSVTTLKEIITIFQKQQK